MKKIILLLAAVLVLGACNDKKETPQVNTPVKATGALKLAFVQLDTLQSQYQYFKDVNQELSEKKDNAQATLQQKAQSLQAQAAAFQSKAQSNAYTQEQYNQELARLQKLEQDGQALEMRLTSSLQEESAKRLQAISDTIQHFIAAYAKERGYDFIFSKTSGIDHLIYANGAFDVTREVVDALNKRYKKQPAATTTSAQKSVGNK